MISPSPHLRARSSLSPLPALARRGAAPVGAAPHYKVFAGEGWNPKGAGLPQLRQFGFQFGDALFGRFDLSELSFPLTLLAIFGLFSGEKLG